jgi:hypothetical protein
MSSREPVSRDDRRSRRGALAIARAVLYWLAVITISLALVVGLVLLLESRDESEIEGEGRAGAALRGRPAFEDAIGYRGSARSSRANTTIRSAAL